MFGLVMRPLCGITSRLCGTLHLKEDTNVITRASMHAFHAFPGGIWLPCGLCGLLGAVVVQELLNGDNDV